MFLIGKGTVITRDSDRPIIRDGAVLVDQGVIKKLDTYDALKQEYPQIPFVDAHNGIIMPGFINTHEHIYSAMARGLSIRGYQPNGFLDILDGMWWNIDRHLTLSQVKLSALSTYLECIRYGVTTIFDHHASYGALRDSLFKIEEAARETGIRSCLCYEISNRDGEDKMKDAVLENEAFIRYATKDTSDMIAGMMGLHASFTLSDATLDFCTTHKPEEAGYHIHVAEGIEDLHDCLKKHGTRIVNRLMNHSILGEKTLLAHCIYVNEQEMDLIKETDTMVVHNPESNMGNACGCPPTMRMVEKGILTGLGTDGYTQDMIESYKVANLLHKHSLCNPNAAWSEIPKMLFEGNATIANRYFKIPLGQLKEGAAADIIVSDYIPNTPLDENNINSHILFGMNGNNIITTIANGTVLMKDREFMTLDEEQILANVREGAGQLFNRLNP
ncbi:MAG: putative aminohydrolase SsnA [Clostridia bacterium]|nr:putative aminohydrolase SsnA [Clostridia bacterium]